MTYENRNILKQGTKSIGEAQEKEQEINEQKENKDEKELNSSL